MKKIFLILILTAALFASVSAALADTVVATSTVGFGAVAQSSASELASEPVIRVGLYKTAKPVEFVSDFSYQIYLGEELAGILNASATATLSYGAGQYSIKSDNLDLQSAGRLRLVPFDTGAYFTLLNYDRFLKRKKVNYNVYRGALEFMYGAKSKMPWVINELPLEQYVAGIAETGDNDPAAYLKAMAVAERTYAYVNIDKASAQAEKTFDVFATTADQLYLGYNSETAMPLAAAAARETAGLVVTYDGQPVVTPYFANSDGKTKSWEQVWGGADRSWLQSVAAVYDKGKKKYGHGVGMSNYDARARAARDGWTYDQILQYYYTGTAVEKIY